MQNIILNGGIFNIVFKILFYYFKKIKILFQTDRQSGYFRAKS